MTHEYDELLEAVLEGTADTDVEKRVNADPELWQRLQNMRTVRSAIAAEVEPPAPAQMDRTMAIALGSVWPDRHRRSRGALIGAAAALLVLCAGAGVLLVGTDREVEPNVAIGSQDPLVPAEPDSPDTPDEIPGSGFPAENMPLSDPLPAPEPHSGDMSDFEPLDLGHLGQLQGPGELAAQVVNKMSEPASTGADPEAALCIQAESQRLGLAPLVGAGTVAVQEQMAAVGALSDTEPNQFRSDDLGAVLVVATLPECAVVLAGRFEMLLR